MAYRVLVTTPLPSDGVGPLRERGIEIIQTAERQLTHSQLVAYARDIDGIVCVVSDQVSNDVLAAGGNRLRVVANIAVGHDNIDKAAAAKLGIIVCNTPGVVDEATADLTFALLLGAARRMGEAQQDLREGRWHGWHATDYLGKELFGATLGLVGFGRIGQAVARRAAGFGMAVVHHTRTYTGAQGWVGNLDDLLRRSDFVSIHVPLNDSTRHLIDVRRLRLMKADAILVNTARGPIVDEAALAEALTSGHLAGAALDVFEHEPSIHPLLLSAPRTLLSPHIGTATISTRTRMAQLACQGVADVLGGRVPTNVVT